MGDQTIGLALGGGGALVGLVAAGSQAECGEDGERCASGSATAGTGGEHGRPLGGGAGGAVRGVP